MKEKSKGGGVNGWSEKKGEEQEKDKGGRG